MTPLIASGAKTKAKKPNHWLSTDPIPRIEIEEKRGQAQLRSPTNEKIA